MYKVDYKEQAKAHLKKLDKSGNKALKEKVARLLGEVETHPKTGTGHPKPLRHHKGDVWARKINSGDRLVYEIFEDEGTLLVTQVLGHYEDK